MALSKVNPNFVSQLGRRNLIINGDMRIAQRGTGAFTANSSYPVDRWNMISNATDFTTTQDSAVPTGKGFTNSIKIQPTATKSPSASTYSRIGYSIEGYDGVSLCWGTSGAKTATISFWVKSSVTGTYSICVKNGAANKSVVQDYTISVADTWEYKTITIPPETSGTWDSVNGRFAYIDIWLAGQGSQTSTTGSWISSNANMSNNQVNFFSSTSNTFNITGFQFEVGSVATPFEHRSYAEELAACQRYYQLHVSNTAFTNTPTVARIGLSGVVQMRAQPSLTIVDATGRVEDFGIANRNLVSLGSMSAGGASGTMGGAVDATITASSNTRPHILFAGSIGLEAEL